MQLTFYKIEVILAHRVPVCWENQFLDMSFPAFTFLKGAAVLEDLFTTDARDGCEHPAQFHETGIATSLDVLKRVMSHTFVAFEGGKGHPKCLETNCQFGSDDSTEL